MEVVWFFPCKSMVFTCFTLWTPEVFASSRACSELETKSPGWDPCSPGISHMHISHMHSHRSGMKAALSCAGCPNFGQPWLLIHLSKCSAPSGAQHGGKKGMV